MDAPTVYCSLRSRKAKDTQLVKWNLTYREIIKVKSFLPKVLLRDGINSKNDFQKQCEYLSREEKSSINYWNHRQKQFIATQRRKEKQSGMKLLHADNCKFYKSTYGGTTKLPFVTKARHH
ncbi:hypothetical protein EB796_023061 [Bugula neritina]|uniref:Uncharacterized protein n=1 Tax=Bugula neritina TaxID=10212 RepID=A0A7J7IYK0_BUGNE|nr:hypothetical protein EB796_023061 [Bugula neritina]